MPKFLFIEPKAPGLHIYSKFPIPRLGNVLLGTMARERGWDVEVVVEDFTELDAADLPAADFVGLSTITSTAPRAYQYADTYRKRGVPVIMGGPHVSFMPDEAMDHSDYVIIGEGEAPFSHFLTAVEAGRGFDEIPNLLYRDGGEVLRTPFAPAPQKLDAVPSPDLSLIRSFGAPGRRLIVPIETSRGCPFNCEFCAVTELFGKRVRYRPMDEVIEEMRRYEGRARLLFFVDDNFTAHKPRTKELLQRIIDSGVKQKWTAQVRSDAADDEELLSMMSRAGCRAVYIGIESVNDETLKRIKKGQQVDDVSRSIARFKRHGIRVHGMFILGFDEDNVESGRKTWRYARRTNLNSVQFLILTPVPGTKFFQRMHDDDRILTEDWSLYDAHHVVYKPKGMLPFELQQLQIKAHEHFYNFWRRVKTLFSFNFWEFAVSCYAKHVNSRWKRMNRFFMRWLKKLSLMKNGVAHDPVDKDD